MRARNTPRCAGATLLALGSVLGPCTTTPAQLTPAPPAATQPTDGLPSPADTMRLYRQVSKWVKQWSVPATPRDDELVAVPGAAIVLRLNGEVIGRGIEVGGSGDVRTVWRTAVAAVAEADRRLPVENDALREENVRQTLSQLTISLEAAGPLIPIDLATFDQADRSLAPGLDGIAVRIGDKLAAISPGTMLATNMSPRQALAAMASQAAGEAVAGLEEPGTLATQRGARLYRFRVTHLAQPGPRLEPVFLYRGARLIDIASINQAELRAMADNIAEHLMTRAWPGAEAYGMSGSYEPWRDAYEPPSGADAIEQLTAVYALQAYMRIPGVSAGQAGAADRFINAVIRDLKRVEPGEPAPWDDVAAAAAWVACGNWAPACESKVTSAFDSPTGFAGSVPPAAKGLVALALVRLAGEQGAPAGALARAEAAVRRAYRDTPEGELVSQMPWLGWAEQRLAALKGDKGDKGGGELPAAVALRQMRAQVWEHQITPLSDGASEARSGGPDMIGGIVFNRAAKGAPPTPARPTWHTARPVAFIAAMLGDSRLTDPAERPLELAKLLTSVRFLRQLQVDDNSTWMCPNRRRALGGIRAATWDQRMPSDASAMTLLAVSETLNNLAAISRK